MTLFLSVDTSGKGIKMNSKILMIDDEKVIIELAKRVFEKRGFSFLGFIKTEDAWPAILKEKPDVIILDNLMPEKNGTEVCHQLKSNPATSHIPVLMTTGHRLAEDSPPERESLFPPDDFLMKPFEIDELVKKVESVIRKG